MAQAAVVTLQHEVKPVTSALLQTIALEQVMETAHIGQSRLHQFIEAAQITDSQSFKDALKQFRKDNKGNKSMEVRASEFQVIYTALIHGATGLDEMGYASAVSAAREFVKSKGLLPNGNPRLSEEERAAKKEDRLAARVREELNKTFNWNQENAAQKFEEEFKAAHGIAKANQEAEELAKKVAAINKLVDSIMADGVEYAVMVRDALNERLGTPEQA